MAGVDDRRHIAAIVLNIDAGGCKALVHSLLAPSVEEVKRLLDKNQLTVDSIGIWGNNDFPIHASEIKLLHGSTGHTCCNFHLPDIPTAWQEPALAAYGVWLVHAHENKSVAVVCLSDNIDFFSWHPGQDVLILTRWDISSLRRLFLNLLSKLYDTPVDAAGKIALLGKSSARLISYLQEVIPEDFRFWKPETDEDLVFKILKYAFRYRIEEPDIIRSWYEYLIINLNKHFTCECNTVYVLGDLADYDWFFNSLRNHLPAARLFLPSADLYLPAFCAAVFSALNGSHMPVTFYIENKKTVSRLHAVCIPACN